MDKRDTSDLILDPRGIHRWGPKAQAAPLVAWACNSLCASFEGTMRVTLGLLGPIQVSCEWTGVS